MPSSANAAPQLTSPGSASCHLVRSTASNGRTCARRDRTNRLTLVTASIAHEVNQPLSGIMTNASTCLRMLNADSLNLQGARDSVLRILRDVSRATEVIGRLRALFVRSALAAESLDVNRLVLDTVALAQAELFTIRVSVTYNLANDLPHMKGDRVQLQQVLLNLIRNAGEAMSVVQHRPRTLTIATRCDENHDVCVSVQDAGVGFDAADSDKLFAPFYTTKPHGMGVGLAVSRSIVEHHRGRLWATPNHDGPGATFCFTIPCAARGSLHHCDADTPAPAEGAAMPLALTA